MTTDHPVLWWVLWEESVCPLEVHRCLIYTEAIIQQYEAEYKEVWVTAVQPIRAEEKGKGGVSLRSWVLKKM